MQKCCCERAKRYRTPRMAGREAHRRRSFHLSTYPTFISNRNSGQRSRTRRSAIQGDQSSERKRNTATRLTPPLSRRSEGSDDCYSVYRNIIGRF
jgi:hypothetical protein